MGDLKTTFRVLDGVAAPDLWPEATVRALSASAGHAGPRPRRRVLAMAVGLVVAVAAVGAAWVTLHGLGHSAPSSPTRLERLQGAAKDIRSALGKVQGELDRNRNRLSIIVARQRGLIPLLSQLAAKYQAAGPRERSRLRGELEALRAKQVSLTERLQLVAAHHGELVAKARSLKDMLDRILQDIRSMQPAGFSTAPT